MTYDVVQPLRAHRVPLSTRAQEYLLGLIESGVYQPGEQLPSEKELSTQLGISRPTLREALRNLEQEGLVIRKHGVGTFVAPGYELRLESGLERLESILELSTRQGMRLRFNALQIEEEQADAELADKLQLSPGSPLTSVRRVIMADKQPVAYMVDLVPASILCPADIDETFNGSVLDLMRRKEDLHVAQALADILALNADPLLAKKLGIKPGQALLLFEETLFDAEGTRLGFSRNYFVPDFFSFQVLRR
jgi:GntR family transcriptional regulator